MYRNTARATQLALTMIKNTAISAEDTVRQYGTSKRKIHVWISSGAPVVTAGDYLAVPVKIGDLVIDSATKDVYIVSTSKLPSREFESSVYCINLSSLGDRCCIHSTYIMFQVWD